MDSLNIKASVLSLDSENGPGLFDGVHITPIFQQPKLSAVIHKL